VQAAVIISQELADKHCRVQLNAEDASEHHDQQGPKAASSIHHGIIAGDKAKQFSPYKARCVSVRESMKPQPAKPASLSICLHPLAPPRRRAVVMS
jgi:hypothetical protein